MTGLDMRLRTTTGKAEIVGESNDAQVSSVLLLFLPCLTRGLESKSAWPLSEQSAPTDPDIMSSGDNFGKLQMPGCVAYLIYLCRRRSPGRYLV